MILDNNTIIADDLAFGGTAEVVNLGSSAPGAGKPLKVFVQGSSDLAGVTGFTVNDGSTSSAGDTLVSHTCDLVGKTIEMELPSDVAQYITIALNGTPSAGSWNAGVVMAGIQTNT